MVDSSVSPAWVRVPTEDEILARSSNIRNHPYFFGFVAGMSRLVGAHDGIGPAFSALFRQIMFEPGALTRAEREMVAAIAAAAQDCTY